MASNMHCKKLLFQVSNYDVSIKTLKPIIERLHEETPEIVCDVLCINNFSHVPTDLSDLNEVFDNVYQLDELVIAKGFSINNLRATMGVMSKFIKEIEPDAIVFTNDRNALEYALTSVAYRYQIPSLLIQAGIRKDLAQPGENVRRHGEGGCSRVLAWGQDGFDYFKMVGVPVDRIVITGNPRIDDFVKRCSSLSKNEVRQQIRIRPDGHVILFATNPINIIGLASLEEYIESIKVVITQVESIGAEENITMIVKPHRVELAMGYHEQHGIVQLCSKSEHVHYLQDITLDSAIAATDMVLVFNSTVALEAALMGKRVGLVNIFGLNLGVDFAEKGLAVELKDIQQLKSFVLNTINEGEAVQPNIQHYVQNIGSSASCITQEIRKLVEMR